VPNNPKVAESETSVQISNDYRISRWGQGYFGINQSGNVAIHPNKTEESIDLHELVQGLVKRGIKAPILLRINGIISKQINEIYSSFRNARKELEYKGDYKLAFPIKVNHQKHVIDAICKAGYEEEISLEVGSKPELTAVLTVKHHENSLVICNGYKDAEYIELALLVRKLKRRSIIIVERRKEMALVISLAQKLGVDFEVGLRIKPNNKGSGRWSSSAGENAKFGLTSYEVMEIIEELKDAGKLDSLVLLHFHIGSQVTSIYSIKKVLLEGTAMFVELFRLVPSLKYFDVGGGLGVDYMGNRSSMNASMNYTIDEYARDVISAISEACNKAGIPHPTVISESGRATVAYHSILVTEVVDAEGDLDTNKPVPTPPSETVELNDLYEMFHNIVPKNCREMLHDTIQNKELLEDLFQQGSISLQEKAYGDKMIRLLLTKIIEISKGLDILPEELANLPDSLIYTYFCNFSIFQSLPDSWALEQVFPIMPIHRLDQEPTCRTVLADLTCDSDGLVEEFIGEKQTTNYLPLHPLRAGEAYYLGIFLVGAYQETLGDLHNLFGDTNAVHVELEGNGNARITDYVEGDSVSEVLSYFQYEEGDLLKNFNKELEKALRTKKITYEESSELNDVFRKSLNSYTYLGKRNS
jgi:arginine decarboxylase